MQKYNARVAIVVAAALLLVNPHKATAAESLQAGEKLTLERAIELTLRNHPRAMEMRSAATAAHERVGEARSSLLPQVYSAGDFFRPTDNPLGTTPYLKPGFLPRFTEPLHGGPANPSKSFSTTDNSLPAVERLWDGFAEPPCRVPV